MGGLSVFRRGCHAMVGKGEFVDVVKLGGAHGARDLGVK
jgi:hypothetical protein